MFSGAFGRGARQGVGMSFGFSYGKGGVSQGFLGRTAEGGMRKNWLGGGIGLAFTGFSVYEGYKEGGIGGAIKAGGSSVLQQAIFSGIEEVTGSLLTNPYLIGAAVIAGGAYAGYQLGEAGIARMKKFRNLEMGGDVIDTFGTMASMRQRSLSAIQNSHVNGRLALGGEAAMMHTPMMR